MGSRSAAAVPVSTPELLIIASGNPSKVAELRVMLAPVQLKVQQQPDGIDIEETGSTYLENARLKAAEVARLTGHWTLADDSGIAVDALGGAPGLYSARYGGPARPRRRRGAPPRRRPPEDLTGSVLRSLRSVRRSVRRAREK